MVASKMVVISVPTFCRCCGRLLSLLFAIRQALANHGELRHGKRYNALAAVRPNLASPLFTANSDTGLSFQLALDDLQAVSYQ